MPTIRRRTPSDKEEGKEVRMSCLRCVGDTRHTIVKSAEYTDVYEDGDFSATGWDAYQVVECAGCQSRSFRHASSNTEDYDHDPRTGDMVFNEKISVYPDRDSGRAKIRDSHFLPQKILGIYSETLEALRVKIPVLAGVGIRAIVETICNDRGAKGRSLRQKIDNLVDQAVFTPDGAKILHSLRIMGNDAAHEVKPHTVDELTVALDVVEHTLSGLYVLPKRAASLPNP